MIYVVEKRVGTDFDFSHVATCGDKKQAKQWCKTGFKQTQSNNIQACWRVIELDSYAQYVQLVSDRSSPIKSDVSLKVIKERGNKIKKKGIENLVENVITGMNDDIVTTLAERIVEDFMKTAKLMHLDPYEFLKEYKHEFTLNAKNVLQSVQLVEKNGKIKIKVDGDV